MHIFTNLRSKDREEKIMDRSAIILAGGKSQRFGTNKALVKLMNKTLISYVLERIEKYVDETIVCIRSADQKTLYSQILPSDIKIAVDASNLPQCPLTGILTGLTNAKGDYSILLPCDTPFLSEKLIDLLFEISLGVDAAIPRWPNGYIEPLQSVYKTKPALKATVEVLERGDYRIRSMISLLKRIRYLSTLVIEGLNINLSTFFNINTPSDLKKAEALIRRYGVNSSKFDDSI